MRTSESTHVTVLLVDDDPDCRQLFGAVLAKDGYRVVEARDGVEALEVIAIETPDVIVTDGAMPRMDGREMALALASHPRWSSIPVIVVSGSAAISADNIVARYTKPISVARLREAVRAVGDRVAAAANEPR